MNEISEFTSHYVSINSINSVDEMQLAVNLHPTMYLLIQSFEPIPVNTK